MKGEFTTLRQKDFKIALAPGSDHVILSVSSPSQGRLECYLEVKETEALIELLKLMLQAMALRNDNGR